MTELFGMQAETLEAIIVALGTSFVGTGTVALIVRVALNRVTKNLKERVVAAESANKISQEQAEQSLASLNIFEEGLQKQVTSMQETIDKLIESQRLSTESISVLLKEYEERDKRIKELIVEEFEQPHE